MDQPQHNDENESQQPMEAGSTPPEQSVDNAVPINVTVVNDDQDQSSDMVDSVLEGVPSMGDAPADTAWSQPSTAIAVETAEHEVEEALPQTTDQELAAVASELEGFSEGDASQPVTSGSDPMQQIMQEAASSEPEAVESMPVSETVTDNTPVVEPEMPSTEPTSEMAEPDNGVENGSMETTNEFGDADPADVHSSPMVVDEPTPQPEENSSEATPMSEPAPESDRTEDMPMANEPGAAPEATPETDSQPTEENTGDIVTPTVVATAIADGTAGDNAITGTPEAAGTQSAQETPQQPMAHPQKSGRLGIVLVVMLVTLLFGGGAVAAYMMRPETTEEVSTSEVDDMSTEDSQMPADDTSMATALPGEEVEASTLDDYKAACSSGGLVTNASAYTGKGPHPVVVFEKGSDDKYAQSLVNFKDTTWSATTPTSGQLVVCIARDASSEVKLKECPVTDAVTKVTTNVPFYSSGYSVTVYEALTGKTVDNFLNTSVSTTCPTTPTYNKADPKIFAVYDQITLETALSKFVTADVTATEN